MIVRWKGRTWGTGDIMVLGLPGIEDRVIKAANVSGGMDGAAVAPKFSDIGAFVADIVVFADSDADMAAKIADVYSVTWGTDDRVTEEPFDFTIRGQSELTVFAAVTNRQNATDFTTRERYRAARIQVAYEATDPMVHAAQVEVELASGDSVEIGGGGWAPTERWTWSVTGPASNAHLLLETPGYPDRIIRCSGSLGSGAVLLVDSYPHDLVTTIDGAPAFGRFDSGAAHVPARFPKLSTGQTVTYLGGGSATFAYRPAKP